MILVESFARGIAMVDLYLDSLNERLLFPARLGEKGYAWMVNSDGTLLYHPPSLKWSEGISLGQKRLVSIATGLLR